MSTCCAFLTGGQQGGIITTRLSATAQLSNLKIGPNRNSCLRPFHRPSCSSKIQYSQRRVWMNMLSSSLTDENEITSDEEEEEEEREEDIENGVVPLKDDEEFIAAVKEVKEAAKNVTASSVQLTSAIVSNVPGIFWRLFTSLVSKEIRYVYR